MLPRIVFFANGDVPASVLNDAAAKSSAARVERAGSMESVLRSIREVRANTLVGPFDFSAEKSRQIIAVLRDPERTPAPHIVIVALTRDLSRDDVVKVIRMGVNQIVVPPHTTARIAERIQLARQRPVQRIDVPSYVGPCRRRAPDDAYDGPNRRTVDVKKAASILR
jgi:PleD family two-component response regulator